MNHRLDETGSISVGACNEYSGKQSRALIVRSHPSHEEGGTPEKGDLKSEGVSRCAD